MAFLVPTFDQIRNRYLQAVVNQWPDAAIGPDSDHYVRATSIAAVSEGMQHTLYKGMIAPLALLGGLVVLARRGVKQNEDEPDHDEDQQP